MFFGLWKANWSKSIHVFLKIKSIHVLLQREEASIILDCGENSCGQLYRLYGPEESEKRLMKLKAIFISHLHADHHLVS